MHSSSINEKKKRSSTSNSRSKAKKISHPIRQDGTVQLKHKHNNIFHNHDICAKIKTQASTSINKSKGSRKTSKSVKRTKGSLKQSKDHSYLVSVERKSGLNKNFKTQVANIENEQILKDIYIIKKYLSKIYPPNQMSTNYFDEYFQQIRQILRSANSKPLETLFLQLHNMYTYPLERFFNLIKPYEQLLFRKQELTELISRQIEQNEKIFQSLQPEDIEIIRLKQRIRKNNQMISKAKKSKQIDTSTFRHQSKGKVDLSSQTQSPVGPKYLELARERNLQEFDKKEKNQFQKKLIEQYSKGIHLQSKEQSKSKQTPPINPINDQQNQIKEPALLENKETFSHQRLQDSSQLERESSQQFGITAESDVNQQSGTCEKEKHKSGGISFNFKLDIPKIDKNSTGFHDQFYSKLDEFSESWRNQALRQKRF